MTDLDRALLYAYRKATEIIRPGRALKEDKVPFDWFHGSWPMTHGHP
jgi:hypothetical protein